MAKRKPKCAWAEDNCDREVPRDGLFCWLHYPLGAAIDAVRPLVEDMARLDVLADASESEGGPAEDQALWRRSLVRATFAAMEATIWTNKQLVARHAMAEDKVEGRPPTFSPGEIACLLEDGYSLESNGKVELRPARLAFAANFQLMARAQARLHGTDYDKQVTPTALSLLREAVRIRDRLVHPKVPTDTLVSGPERVAVGNAYGFVVLTGVILTGHPVEAPPQGWPWEIAAARLKPA